MEIETLCNMYFPILPFKYPAKGPCRWLTEQMQGEKWEAGRRSVDETEARVESGVAECKLQDTVCYCDIRFIHIDDIVYTVSVALGQQWFSWELQQTMRTVDSICLFATEQTKTQRVAKLLISVPLMVRGDLDTKEGPMRIPPQFKGHIVHIL